MPSLAEVKRCIEIWNTSDKYEKYRRQEESVNMLFKKQYPKNTVLEEVLIKVSVLNDFYSTNIRDTFSVAKHIVNLNIDDELCRADTGIVDRIAQITINEKKWRFYSFATKYCSHHYPNEYPICDNIVSKVLLNFKYKEEFAKFKKEDIRNYPVFKAIILDFRKFYKLEEFSLKELDKYLWVLGKESFQKTQ